MHQDADRPRTPPPPSTPCPSEPLARTLHSRRRTGRTIGPCSTVAGARRAAGRDRRGGRGGCPGAAAAARPGTTLVAAASVALAAALLLTALTAGSRASGSPPPSPGPSRCGLRARSPRSRSPSREAGRRPDRRGGRGRTGWRRPRPRRRVNHYYGAVPTILHRALALATLTRSRPRRWRPPHGGLPMAAWPRPRNARCDRPRRGADSRNPLRFRMPGRPGHCRPGPRRCARPAPGTGAAGGQPGGTSDWLDGGGSPPALDRDAAAHHGIAPVVVMPDDLGSELADPQCLDPPGPATTYLSVDVPAVDRNLQVGPARAVAGLSYGGTCALRLALTAPAVYPTFLDIAGDPDPTLLDLLAARRLPDTQGALVVGRQDPSSAPTRWRWPWPRSARRGSRPTSPSSPAPTPGACGAPAWRRNSSGSAPDGDPAVNTRTPS